MTRYPGAVACAFLVLGILLGGVIRIPDFAAFCFTLLLLVMGLLALQRRNMALLTVIGACCLVLIGIFRYNLLAANPAQNAISRFNDLPHEVTVIGHIAREPDIRPDKTLLTIECDSLDIRERTVPASGLLLAAIRQYDDRFGYGFRVAVRGFVRTPVESRNFHGFDYRRYLGLKRIHSYVGVRNQSDIFVIEENTGNSLVSDVIIPLRGYILDTFGEHIVGSERHLIAGLLIGEIRFIPRQIYERFRDTGTLHLLAVSGSNVALVVVTVMALFRIVGIPRRLVDLLSLPVVAIFCHLSFNQPSVIRASVMISLVVIGRVLYRKGNLVNITAVAALFILLCDPLMLYDVGFQLSFAAAFSLVYFVKGFMPKQRRYPGRRRWIREYGWMILLSSVVVQLTVAPILAYYFGTIPLVTFASNLVVIPLSSAALILSLLLVMLSPLPVLPDLTAVAAQLFLHLTIHAVDLFASMPVVKLTIARPGIVHIAFYYGSLFGLFSFLRNRQRLKCLVLVLLIWGNIFAWQKVAARFWSSPEVTFLDLGQHAGIHAHFPPSWDIILTDVGPETCSDHVERVIMPYLLGEGVGDIDRWEMCAPSRPDNLDSVTGAHCTPCRLPGISYMRRFDTGGILRSSSVQLSKSQYGIEIASFNYAGRAVVWLSRWELLNRLERDSVFSCEILALPYPDHDVESYLDEIIRLSPDNLVIYNHFWSRTRSDLDSAVDVIESSGISVFDTHRCGAIRFQLKAGRTGVRLSATGR